MQDMLLDGFNSPQGATRSCWASLARPITRGRFTYFILAAVAVAMLASASWARDFKSNEYNVQARRLRRIVQQCVNDPSTYADEKEQFNEYFLEYYFPFMTQATPDELGEIGKMRYDFFRLYVWSTSNEELQSDLTEMAKNYMQKVLADTAYHPSVRYNAILMLGMLDEQYPPERGEGQAKPLPEITKLLLNILAAAGKSSKVTPDLVVGALIGLERHAKHSDSLSPEHVKTMESAMLYLISKKELVKGIDADVAAWIKRQAAGVLAQLGQPGQGGRAIKGLLSMIGNEELPLTERCNVAAMLPRLNLEEADLDEISEQLIVLADDLGQFHADKAREFEDTQLGGRGGRTRGFNSRSSFGGQSQGRGYDRRRLVAHLESLADGMEPVEAAADGDAKTRMADVLAAIDQIRGMAKDDETLDIDLAAEVKRMALEIGRVADLYNIPAEPAVEAPAEDLADEEGELDS